MSDKVRDLLINLAIGAAVSAAVFALNMSREYGVLRCVCDGFFVAAVFLLGIGGIKAVRNSGSFDVAGFGLRHVVNITVPALRRGGRRICSSTGSARPWSASPQWACCWPAWCIWPCP